MEVKTQAEKKTVTWKIDLRRDWCTGCSLCIKVCPVDGIFTLAEENGMDGFVPINVNPKDCTGCMICELSCPEYAIRIEEV